MKSIDKNLLRYMTVKVKKFDLEANTFQKKKSMKKKNIKKRLIMPSKKRSDNKKGKQSNFAKLSIFQPNKYKFKKSCPLSVKGAPDSRL